MSQVNLDYYAAKCGQQITKLVGPNGVSAKDADNLVTKALGVVQESGVFACGLFLLSRSGVEVLEHKLKGEHLIAAHTLLQLVSLADPTGGLGGIQPLFPETLSSATRINAMKAKLVEHLVKIAELDLPLLYLVKQTWEQALTYARHIARSQRKAVETPSAEPQATA